MSSSPGLALADGDPDVVVAAAPVEHIESGAPVVLLGEPAWSVDALRHGIRAMLRPDAPSSEIVAAVHAAASGLAAVDPRDLEGWLAENSARAAGPEAGHLTPRETEVLQLMAEGAANKIIAWKLNISEHTAKFHVASVLSKLNAGTRTEAVALGIKRGWILL